MNLIMTYEDYIEHHIDDDGKLICFSLFSALLKHWPPYITNDNKLYKFNMLECLPVETIGDYFSSASYILDKSCNYEKVDKNLGGVRKSELILFSAKSGGKSVYNNHEYKEDSKT